jgi:hypothetical protein
LNGSESPPLLKLAFADRRCSVKRMNLRALILLAAFAAAPLIGLAENVLTPAEQSDGWRLLFDGESLKGWRSLKSEMPGKGWEVADGVIVLKGGKPGDLVTNEEFGDFELSFEWKVTETANSGVIFRAGLNESATYRTGPEYQVLDNAKAVDNKQANHLAGSLYDLAGPSKDFTKPVGEWNTAQIEVRGWHVQHWLNGEKVVDVDLASPAGKALIAASKFKDWTTFASLSRGHIALQDHGHEVSFRAIKVRELK